MDERFSDVPVAGTSQPQQTERSYSEVMGEEEQRFAQKAEGYANRGREQVRHFGEVARRRLMKTGNQRKQYVAAEMENLAGTLDEVGRSLADRGHASQQQYVSRGSDLLRRFSRELRQRSAEELVGRAEREVRSHPGAFIVGCLAAGFLGARLLKG